MSGQLSDEHELAGGLVVACAGGNVVEEPDVACAGGDVVEESELLGSLSTVITVPSALMMASFRVAFLPKHDS
jgi:hypothetical protein